MLVVHAPVLIFRSRENLEVDQLWHDVLEGGQEERKKKRVSEISTDIHKLGPVR